MKKKHLDKSFLRTEAIVLFTILILGVFFIFISSRLPMPKPVMSKEITSQKPGTQIEGEGFVKDLDTGNTYLVTDIKIREEKSWTLLNSGISLILCCGVYGLLRLALVGIESIRNKN